VLLISLARYGMVRPISWVISGLSAYLLLWFLPLRFIPQLVFKPDLEFDNFVNESKMLHNHT
jgi:hypothetical protein